MNKIEPTTRRRRNRYAYRHGLRALKGRLLVRGLQSIALGLASPTAFSAPVFAARMEFPGSNLEPLVLRDFVGAALNWNEPERPGRPIIALLGRAALVNYLMIYNGLRSSITLIRRQP